MESTIDFQTEKVTYVIEIPILDEQGLAGAQYVADQIADRFGFVATRIKREKR